jgi:hypothetical protein
VQERDPLNTSSGEQSPELPTALELKEIIEVFREEFVDIESVMRILEQVMEEPVPDPSDRVAVDEYNAKMAIIKETALRYELVSEHMKSLKERLEAKAASQPNNG